MSKNSIQTFVQRHSAERNMLMILDHEISPSGKLLSKTESCAGKITKAKYTYDKQGRLILVMRNSVVAERYTYNGKGQRIYAQKIFSASRNDGHYQYDTNGRLRKSGAVFWAYDESGALSERNDVAGTTVFFYDGDTFLDNVILPGGKTIRYEYDKSASLCPVRRYCNNTLTNEYTWDGLQLASSIDHESQLEFSFTYDNASRHAETVRIAPMPLVNGAGVAEQPSPRFMDQVHHSSRMRMLRYFNGGPRLFRCGCDQVGTLKVIVDQSGFPCKVVERDSFGVQISDSMPSLFLPIGFAGGLEDPDTGLIRFGHRDYAPGIGRFTAPDPARDMRGDGDLYDYCSDDPVSRVDQEGLQWTSATFDESKVNRDYYGRFSSGGGGGGESGKSSKSSQEKIISPLWQSGKAITLSSGILHEVTANASRAANTGGEWRESIQALPKAPPPMHNNLPLTRFEELVLKENLSDRETLPQYYKVTSGASLNSGHSKGFETRELRANDDILVYVKNYNAFFVPVEVKAGPSFTKNKTQAKILAPFGGDAVFRFRNHGQLTRYLSIDSQADSFLVEYHVFTRGHYAPR